LESTTPKPNEVVVDIINVCSASAIPGSFQVSIMVYDKWYWKWGKNKLFAPFPCDL